MNDRMIRFFLGFFATLLLVNLMKIDKSTDSLDLINLSASFDKIDGVQEGTSVMISGIEIGRVEKVFLDDNHPNIIMKVTKNNMISKDSSISIQTDGLFGNKFLSIEIGGTDEFMIDGDKFSFSEDSVLVEELLEKIIKIGEKNKKGDKIWRII